MDTFTPRKRLFSPIYAKLNEDGTPDSNKLLDQSDYDSLVSFMKFSFPLTLKIHREMEDNMKRTFVFGKKSDSKQTPIARRKRSSAGDTNHGVKAKKYRVDRSVPRNLQYIKFIELNSLWKSYVADVLRDDTSVKDIQQKLNRIDMHGAIIKVSTSNCSSFLNLEGIVVKETKNTFIIVTSMDETKTIPKNNNTFQVIIPEHGIMEIAGSCFMSRPAERTTKKIKSFIEFLGPKNYRRQLLDLT